MEKCFRKNIDNSVELLTRELSGIPLKRQIPIKHHNACMRCRFPIVEIFLKTYENKNTVFQILETSVLMQVCYLLYLLIKKKILSHIHNFISSLHFWAAITSLLQWNCIPWLLDTGTVCLFLQYSPLDVELMFIFSWTWENRDVDRMWLPTVVESRDILIFGFGEFWF